MSGMIASFQAGAVTLLRTQVGQWLLGRYESGSRDETPLEASVQKLTPNDLLQLPEGRRTRENIRVYTPTKLRTSDENAGIPADLVRWRNKLYEVHSVEDWNHTDLPHFLCFASKFDGEGEGDDSE